MMRGGMLRRDVNGEGWKVYHIERVSDWSRRAPVETLDDATLQARFRPRWLGRAARGHCGRAGTTRPRPYIEACPSIASLRRGACFIVKDANGLAVGYI
jgi:hypothetical protein